MASDSSNKSHNQQSLHYGGFVNPPRSPPASTSNRAGGNNNNSSRRSRSERLWRVIVFIMVGIIVALFFVSSAQRKAQKPPPAIITDVEEDQATESLIDAMEHSIATDKATIERIIDEHDCTSAYLDVGTNIAVQIRKLYEPHLYTKPEYWGNRINNITQLRNATMLPRFESTYGPTPRCRVCAFGFEPNPNHHERLGRVQAHLRALGYGVKVFHAAAAETDGVVHFRVTNKKHMKMENEDWGAKRLDKIEDIEYSSHDYKTIAARSVDVSRIFSTIDDALTKKAKALGMEKHGPITMKLDIESGEFGVLPHLLRTGVLCRVVDEAYIEWHEWFFTNDPIAHYSTVSIKAMIKGMTTTEKKQQSYRAPGDANAIVVAPAPPSFPEAPAADDAMQTFQEYVANNCKTKMLDDDDETYLHDGQPMDTPTHPMC